MDACIEQRSWFGGYGGTWVRKGPGPDGGGGSSGESWNGRDGTVYMARQIGNFPETLRRFPDLARASASASTVEKLAGCK